MRGTWRDSAIRAATISRSGRVSTIVRTLVARVAQDGVRFVGFTEESAIDPATKPVGKSAADRRDRHPTGDDGCDARDSDFASEQRRRSDRGRHQQRDLDRSDPSTSQHVLQALPDGDAHVHRAVHDDHVCHRQREQK